jgi:hypothetical protein
MDLEVLRAKLSQGAGNGTTLTAAECELLLQQLPPPPRRRGRKPDPRLQRRDMLIATLLEAYEAEMLKGYGVEKMEAAVAKVVEIFDVTRSHVFACRARYINVPPITEMDHEERQQLIWSCEDKNREANRLFLEDCERREHIARLEYLREFNRTHPDHPPSCDEVLDLAKIARRNESRYFPA